MPEFSPDYELTEDELQELERKADDWYMSLL